MSYFLRLLGREDKAGALANSCCNLRAGKPDPAIFSISSESFDSVPGKPFSYWVSDAVRESFRDFPAFESGGRKVRVGLQTSDDFRFLRGWWEVLVHRETGIWFPFAKGGAYSPYYSDIYLVVNWKNNGKELESFSPSVIRNSDYYFRPGITWPLRSHRFSPQAMPRGCIFSVRGYSAFAREGEELETLAVFNSVPFDYIFKTALGRFGYPEFIVGILQLMPWSSASDEKKSNLGCLAYQAWSLKRKLDMANETSHAFLLPEILRGRFRDYDPQAIYAELADIQAQIDDIAFGLYGFSEEDRKAALGDIYAATDTEEISGDEESAVKIVDAPPLDALLSWAVGVVFGRFDWRLASGEREAPPEPEPFDPLPVKSPGMLPDGDEPYHRHVGILVDDSSHEHDLPRLMADVLQAVDVEVDEDLRRWLRRDFFKYHLQQYSKSRRKAPIFWPLATASGSYALWLYYSNLTDQTLFTSVNDFIEPKLKQVDSELANLRLAGASRSHGDEKRHEELSDFRDELANLRDSLLDIAPSYKPNHDDGVQITAAPLWPLFHHMPWQNVLRDTWEKLEQGEYDWSHLAMAYWPERVREKCITDKSLAIAHDLEHLYAELEPVSKKTRGRKKNTGSGE
ncbi:hypothetical protein [Ferrimonas sp.]|uniref:hypothetical protein n=1 Tax=Ferrimonas sp. TaxID=2080861 RepID=UPI003A8E9473